MEYGELNLDQVEAIVNKLGGMEGVQRFLSGEMTIKGDLLKRVATVTVQAVTKFSAEATFGATKPAVKLWGLGNNFKRVMLGKVEEAVEATTLTTHTLTKASRDAPILAELGDRAEVSLAHLWQMLLAQANGEKGPLLTNGGWNVSYIRDASGTLWAVAADWDAGGGWGVDADSVDSPYGWDAGGRVLSRE
jgi:hypothetical protein